MEIHHKILSQAHFICALIAIISALIGLGCLFKKSHLHSRFGAIYFLFALLSVLLSTGMTIYFWFDPKFALFNSSPASEILRHYNSIQIASIGYAHAHLGAAVFLSSSWISVTHRLVFSLRTQFAIHALIGLFLLDALAYILLTHFSTFYIYMISMAFLLSKFALSLLFVHQRRFCEKVVHGYWALFGLIVFIETGVTGGGRAMIWGSLARSIPLFIVERIVFFILPFLCLWLLIRQEKITSVK